MHDALMRLRKQLACGAGEEAWGRGRGGGEEREKREGKSRPRKKVDVRTTGCSYGFNSYRLRVNKLELELDAVSRRWEPKLRSVFMPAVEI